MRKSVIMLTHGNVGEVGEGKGCHALRLVQDGVEAEQTGIGDRLMGVLRSFPEVTESLFEDARARSELCAGAEASPYSGESS